MDYSNYSTTYKNKTVHGKRLSIKNGVVYINGRVAPEGYKWYDSKSLGTYRVGKGGKFDIIKVGDNKISNKGYISDVRRIAKNLHNFAQDGTINNLKNSNGTPKLNYEIINAGDKRYRAEEPYFIPTYLPNVLTIKINKGKRFLGAYVPTNVLDSIYKYSNKAGIPFNEALGLTGENSFNMMPSGYIARNKLNYDDFAKEGNYQFKKEDGRMGYYPSGLFNNFHYYETPQWGVARTLMKRGILLYSNNDDTNKYHESALNNVDIRPITAHYNSPNFIGYEETNKIVDNALKYMPEKKLQDNPFIDAFEYLRDYNYGMGDGYRTTSANLGNELLRNPAVSNYVKTIK